MAAASHGVAITISSAFAASIFSAAVICSSFSGHAETISSRISRARYLLREPTVISYPTDASLAAKAFPAGPVAPNKPIFMVMILGNIALRNTDGMFFIYICRRIHEL